MTMHSEIRGGRFHAVTHPDLSDTVGAQQEQEQEQDYSATAIEAECDEPARPGVQREDEPWRRRAPNVGIDIPGPIGH